VLCFELDVDINLCFYSIFCLAVIGEFDLVSDI